MSIPKSFNHGSDKYQSIANDFVYSVPWLCFTQRRKEAQRRKWKPFMETDKSSIQ